MTGAELAAQLDEFLATRPELSRWRIGVMLYGRRSGIDSLRRIGQPTAKMIARIQGIIDNPPPDAFKRVQQRAERKPRRARNPANALNGLKRSNRQRAEARISAGLPLGGGQAVRLTQIALQKLRSDEERLKDPLEQAKTKLRRNGRVVYSMSIYGGPADKFIVSGRGSEPVSANEIMAMARRLAA